MSTVRTPTVNVRWMESTEVLAALDIERACFGADAIGEDVFRDLLRARHLIPLVADLGLPNSLVGYMLYTRQYEAFQLVTIAVHPEHQRHGVGAALVNRLIATLRQARGTDISTLVRESNLTAHLFFKACGFKATSIVKTPWEGKSGEDGYLFQFSLGKESNANSVPKGRGNGPHWRRKSDRL